jgi:integrase
VGKTTINRYLATLRKALHYASNTLELIQKVPKIKLFPKSGNCERQREFIFDDDEYRRWLVEAPEELRDASILARNCGICEGELLALQRDCVKLSSASNGDLWGYIDVKRGLKREARRRQLNINPAMREVLLRQMQRSKCSHVFAAIDNPKKPLTHYTLSGQARDMKRKVSFDRDAGLHTLHHTYLTEMGKITDVWTLMKLAGHSNITTTQRYVHPEADAMSKAAQDHWTLTESKKAVAKTVITDELPIECACM